MPNYRGIKLHIQGYQVTRVLSHMHTTTSTTFVPHSYAQQHNLVLISSQLDSSKQMKWIKGEIM